MSRLAQANRVRRAEYIIRHAYGIDRTRDPRVVRFELLRDHVALVLLRDRNGVWIRVAESLPSGRMKQLRKASRRGLAGFDVIRYLETLYKQYGSPYPDDHGHGTTLHGVRP